MTFITHLVYEFPQLFLRHSYYDVSVMEGGCMERAERMPQAYQVALMSFKSVVRNLRPTNPRPPRWDEYETY